MKQELIEWLPSISEMSIEKSANNSYIIKDREGDVSVEMDLSSAKYFVRTGAAESHYKDLLAFLLERYASYIEGLFFDTSSYQQISTKAYIGQERGPKEKLIEEIIAILFKQNPQLSELDNGEYKDDYRIYPDLFKNEAIADLLKKLILESKDSKFKTEALVFFLKANDLEMNKIVANLLSEIDGIDENDLIQIIPFIYENKISNADELVHNLLQRLYNFPVIAKLGMAATEEEKAQLFKNFDDALNAKKYCLAIYHLTAGLPIDYENIDSYRAFSLAIVAGDTNLMRIVKAKGADINILLQGRSMAFAAAFYSTTQAAELLMSWGYELKQFIESNGDKIFHFMAATDSSRNIDHAPMVKFLVEKGANINEYESINAYNNSPQLLTALHVAVLEGDVPIIEILLQNGANIGAVVDNNPPYGVTALDLAIDQENYNSIAKLMEYGAKITTLEFSILYYKCEKVTQEEKANWQKLINLAASKAGKNEIEKFIKTATEFDDIDNVLILAQKSENPSGKDIYNEILYRAACYGSFKVAKKMVDLGGDVNYKNKDEGEYSVMKQAAHSFFGRDRGDRKALIKLLIDNGANYKELLQPVANSFYAFGVFLFWGGILSTIVGVIGIAASLGSLVFLYPIVIGVVGAAVGYGTLAIANHNQSGMSRRAFVQVMMERDAEVAPSQNLGQEQGIDQLPVSDQPNSHVFNPTLWQKLKAHFKGYS